MLLLHDKKIFICDKDWLKLVMSFCKLGPGWICWRFNKLYWETREVKNFLPIHHYIIWHTVFLGWPSTLWKYWYRIFYVYSNFHCWMYLHMFITYKIIFVTLSKVLFIPVANINFRKCWRKVFFCDFLMTFLPYIYTITFLDMSMLFSTCSLCVC